MNYKNGAENFTGRVTKPQSKTASPLKRFIIGFFLLMGFGQVIVTGIHLYLESEWASFLKSAHSVQAKIIDVQTTTRRSSSYNQTTKTTSYDTRDIFLVHLEFRLNNQPQKKIIESGRRPKTAVGQTIQAYVGPKEDFNDIRILGLNQNPPPILVMRLIAAFICLFWLVPYFLFTVVIQTIFANSGVLKKIEEIHHDQKRKSS